MTIDEYISNINAAYQRGNATEHTYRGDLKILLESIVTEISVTNEPKRQKCGAPDYIVMNKEIEIGYIEAKDIGDDDLDGLKKNKEQFDRYKKAQPNLIFTDYLKFHFYKDGKHETTIAIAELKKNKIVAIKDNQEIFTHQFKYYCLNYSLTINSAKRLAELMAGKALLLANIIANALESDETHKEDSTLKDQMQGFKDILIHDITPKSFADIYAQTIAYGLFAARLKSPSLNTFSRLEASVLIPKSNPFLRKLFGYIAGPDIDDRIVSIVNSLVTIFLSCNVAEILKDYGKTTKMEDPIIHFYETFLSEYDPALRKARGVWYTPQPVVNFIVRAVDDILKTEFGLTDGLADNSKTEIEVIKNGIKTKEEVHRVQILDPATGTGTFLAEVVKQIHKRFEGEEGMWSNYVETDLLPRLNGFEILMASYAMAHLQMDLLLTELGFKPSHIQRLKIYLTNSLEGDQPYAQAQFAGWLSAEANEANQIKRDTPVMCVIGNPPYAISSSNASTDIKGKKTWIGNLIADYKKDLNEKNIQPLSDDYIKFIRFGQHYIDKNGSGILAYISNNSFIDGIIHRQMRKHLLDSFDKVYIIDLHGNAKKKEVCFDGSLDQNIFDIMQGVSINIFVKTGKKKKNELAKILHYELQGSRESKYSFLKNNSLNLKWDVLESFLPNYFFVKKNFPKENSNLFFKIEELFRFYNSGLTTEFDELAIQDTLDNSKRLLELLKTKKSFEIEEIYHLGKDKLDKINNAIKDVNLNESTIKRIYYRPFDFKHTIYTGKSNGIMGRPRNDLMKHFSNENLGLVIGRQGQAVGGMPWNVLTITNTIVDSNVFYRGRGTVCPLYLYPDKSTLKMDDELERIPNLTPEITKQIAKKIDLVFSKEKEETENTFAPIDILDYIYAVLHSPTYREKYKEFLKIDFPRVPYPKDQDTFWQLVKLGRELRLLHLMESPLLQNKIAKYPVSGTDTLEKAPKYIALENSTDEPAGNVWINDTQYFSNVPLVAWEFYIGGYQPAQKWLKDRRDRQLDYNDQRHYQKIITALYETNLLMKEIDKIEIEGV